MSKESKEKPILSVRVSQDAIDLLDKLVEETGLTRPEVVERCLMVGLRDQEEFVHWCKHSLKGPFMELLSHPRVVTALMAIVGGEPDSNQRKALHHVRGKRKAVKGQPKPAV